MRLGRLKLKHQIILFITVSAFLLILIQAFYWLSFYNLTKDRASKYEQKIIDQTFVKIDSVLKDIKTNTSLITLDRSMQKFVITDDNYQRDIVLGPFILDLMEYVKTFNSIIYSIQIQDNSGRSVDNLTTTEGNIYNSKEYSGLIKKYNATSKKFRKPLFTGVMKDPTTGKKFFFYLAPIIEIMGGENFAEKMGMCTIMINTANIQELIKNSELTPNSTLAILDNENRIIASNDNKNQGMIFDAIPLKNISNSDRVKEVSYKGRKFIIQQKNLEEADGWKIISVIPVNELITDMNGIERVGVLSVIFMIAILFGLGLMFFKNITQPITLLVKDMKEIGERRLNFRLKLHSTNEVGILAEEINDMIDRIEEMTGNILENQTRMYALELEKKRAEYSALQSQINPHFLYNTLNCISSIGLAHGIKEIAQISTSMSMIFRYSVKPADLVFIREEAECIKAYLNIITIRYGGKYSSKIDIDECLMGMKSPKMVLQPIVENAVYHGLENNQHGGEVTIKGYVDENSDVCFSIFDSGSGIEPDKLESINGKLINCNQDMREETYMSTSIGLVNINNRIKLLFGDRYGISIESKLGWGTRVLIRIPAVEFDG